MSYGPICSNSRWVTELLCRDAYVRNTQNLESGIREWVQVTDVPSFLGATPVVLHSSLGQVVVVSCVRTVSFISTNCGSVAKDRRLIPANHSTTSLQPR
jgi:hypothetical protein